MSRARNRLALFSILPLALGLTLLTGRLTFGLDEPDAAVFNLRTRAGEMDGVISRLSGSAPEARSYRDSYQAKVAELERLASDMGNLRSRMDSQKNHVGALRIECETALGEYEQFNREYDDRARMLDIDGRAWAEEIGRYESDSFAQRQDAENQHADARAYDAAVAHYNSLPPEQRSQAEFERLVAWKTRVDDWCARVNAWAARLDEWARNLKSRQISLRERLEQLAKDAQQLLDLRLRASEKERNWHDANVELQRMAAEYDSLNEMFNAGVSEANGFDASFVNAVNGTGLGTGAEIHSNSSDNDRRDSSGTTRVFKPTSSRPILPDSKFMGRGEGTANAPFGGGAVAAEGSFQVDFLKRENGIIPSTGKLVWQASPHPKSDLRRTEYGTYIQTWVFESELGTAEVVIEGSETEAAGTATGWSWMTERDGQEVPVHVHFGVQFSGNLVRLLGFYTEIAPPEG